MRAALLLLAALVLAGCADDEGSGASTADCQALVRFGGEVYAGYGAVASVPARALGPGDLSDCDDTSPDGVGAYFAEDPPQAQVWSLEGYAEEQVVAVGEEAGALQVYVAADLAPDERDRLLEELAP